MASLNKGKSVQNVQVPVSIPLHHRVKQEAARRGISERELYSLLMHDAVERGLRPQTGEPDQAA